MHVGRRRIIRRCLYDNRRSGHDRHGSGGWDGHRRDRRGHNFDGRRGDGGVCLVRRGIHENANEIDNRIRDADISICLSVRILIMMVPRAVTAVSVIAACFVKQRAQTLEAPEARTRRTGEGVAYISAASAQTAQSTQTIASAAST